MIIRGSGKTLADCVYVQKAVAARIRQCPATFHGYAWVSTERYRRTFFGNYRFTIEVDFATRLPASFNEIVWGHVYAAAVLTFGLLGVRWIRMRSRDRKITVTVRNKPIDLSGSDVYRIGEVSSLTSSGLSKIAAEATNEDK